MSKFKIPRYIIVPKEIFLSKELRPIDTQIYGVIYWYESMKEGVCFASNNAIAEACGSMPSTISKGITRLEENGFIKRIENGKKRRIIALVDPNKPVPNGTGIEETCPEQDTDPSQTGLKPVPNGTQSISKSNSIEYDTLNFLPKELGDSPLKRIISFYQLLWKDLYGTPYDADFGRLGFVLKKTINNYTEYQIACFIITHFDWHGASGESQFAHSKLEEACFPLAWIPNNINQYMAYLVNERLVKMEDSVEVKKYVVAYVKRNLKK